MSKEITQREVDINDGLKAQHQMIKSLFDIEGIPYIDSSQISVEEMATSIIQLMEINRPPIY
mgnify:CR=1 FL=1